MTELKRTEKISSFCGNMIKQFTTEQNNRIIHIEYKEEITKLAKTEFPKNWKNIVKILFFGY